MQLSIPEQVEAHTKFILKRRFFVMTQKDIESSLMCEQLYYDFFLEYQTGNVKFTEESALKAATFQIIAECEDPSMYKNLPPDFDLKPYLPRYMEAKQAYLAKVIQTLSNTTEILRHQAMKNYITTVRDLKFFGVEYFTGNFGPKSVSIPINIANGPFGIQIF